MNPHFFTAFFTLLSFGSGFRALVAASPPFLEDDILVSQPSPLGNAIKLSGRTFLGSPSGELPEGLVQANWIFRSEATRKSSETPF